MNNKIKQFLSDWELQNYEVKQIYNTTWQIGNDYVLKVYRDPGMLERNLKILRVLDEMNIPVGKIVPTKCGEFFSSKEAYYAFLSVKLPGSNIVTIGDDAKFALKMGEIIADLHAAFKECDNRDAFWTNSLLDEMNGWVKSNFETWKYVSRKEFENTVEQLAKVYDKLPVQLIHRDIHFGNFLFSEGEFSGYIDFDLSQRNIRIFDLCYFLLGLLSEEVKLKIAEETWFEFLKNVFIGYGNKLQLTEEEKKAVPYVMECIELLFVSY